MTIMNKIVIALIAVLALSGCAQVQAFNSTVAADLPTAQQAAQAAINIYQIDKGLAEVAMVADPSLAAVIAPAIALADPLVAKAQADLNSATAVASDVMSLAQTIQAQATAIAATAAPAIKVVPAQ
jgi:uncharacterized protein YceK